MKIIRCDFCNRELKQDGESAVEIISDLWKPDLSRDTVQYNFFCIECYQGRKLNKGGGSPIASQTPLVLEDIFGIF